MSMRRFVSCSSETPFVFHHIPKCGGTSLVRSFYTWFSVINDYDSMFDSLEQYCDLPADESALNAALILVGHWNRPSIYLRTRYPRIWKSQSRYLFSIVREPLDLQRSLYRYSRRNPKAAVMDEIDFLNLRENYLSEQFGCNESNYQEVLGRYSQIGIFEDLQGMLSCFAKQALKYLMNRPDTLMTRRAIRNFKQFPVPQIQHLNQTVVSTNDSLDVNVVDRFKERNALDYKIYDHIRSVSVFGNE